MGLDCKQQAGKRRWRMGGQRSRLLALTPVLGLVVGCGAEDTQPAGDRPEPVAIADEFAAPPNTGVTEDPVATEVAVDPIVTEVTAGSVARVPFDFPKIGISGMIPDGFEMTLSPRMIQTPLEGVTIGAVNWVGIEEKGALTISIARGLEATNRYSPELRPGVRRIEGSRIKQGLSQFDDDSGATEVFWRHDEGTVVTVVGNGVADSGVLISIAETLVVAIPVVGGTDS